MKKYTITGQPFIDDRKPIVIFAKSKKQAIAEAAYMVSKDKGISYTSPGSKHKGDRRGYVKTILSTV